MLRVSQSADKVILDLGGRKRDVLLTPLSAVRLADLLEEKAALAEGALPELVRGEVWSVHVRSFNAKVALRFTHPHLGAPERVPLPAGAARALAQALRSNARAAGYGFRLITQQPPWCRAQRARVRHGR